jgi:drug/metabolite transporter (DMT)-like permease
MGDMPVETGRPAQCRDEFGARFERAMITVLVLISAFLHAAWNALLKREDDKDRALIAAVAIGGLLAIAVATVRAAAGGEVPFPTLPSFGWALVAGGFEQLYFAGLARALDRGPLGPVYTISRGGAVVVVYPLSVLLFHEFVTGRSLAGSALVVLGLVLSGLRIGRTPGRAMTSSATVLAIGCACAIAAYHLAYKAALEAGGASSAVFAASLTFATAINIVRSGPLGRRAIAALVRKSWPRITLMGCLCGGSFLLLIEALATGGAGYALTLRNTSVLFAVGLAWMIGERPRFAPALGAAFVAAGAIAMSL